MRSLRADDSQIPMPRPDFLHFRHNTTFPIAYRIWLPAQLPRNKWNSNHPPNFFSSKVLFFYQLNHYYSKLAHLKFYKILDSSSSVSAPKACEVLPEPIFSLPPHLFHTFLDFFLSPPRILTPVYTYKFKPHTILLVPSS